MQVILRFITEELTETSQYREKLQK